MMTSKSRMTILCLLSMVLIIAFFTFSCGDSSPTAPAGCETKGFINKVCASEKDIRDVYEWDGNNFTNHTTERYGVYDWWSVKLINESDFNVDTCIEGDYDADENGIAAILESNVIISANNEYPEGPPCIYVR